MLATTARFWQPAADWLSHYVNWPDDVLGRVLWTLGLGVVYLLLRSLVGRVAAGRIHNAARRYVVIKTINYLIGLVLLIALVRIWHLGVEHVATYLGLVSAAMLIVLSAPVTNFAAWIAIIVQKPFVVGDRITVNNTSGDVVDVSLFNFTLLEVTKEELGEQSTGRIIHIPNNVVFRENITNSTQGFSLVWNEVAVMLTPASNWTVAKEILGRLAKEASADKVQAAADALTRAGQRYMVYYGHLTPIVWTNFRDKKIVLTVRYLCEPRQRRVSTSKLWEQILAEFRKHPDLELA